MTGIYKLLMIETRLNMNIFLIRLHWMRHYQVIKKRLEEPRRFIQVVMGPRQVGKSTVVRQVLADVSQPYSMFTADAVPAGNMFWISECWESVRRKMKAEG